VDPSCESRAGLARWTSHKSVQICSMRAGLRSACRNLPHAVGNFERRLWETRRLQRCTQTAEESPLQVFSGCLPDTAYVRLRAACFPRRHGKCSFHDATALASCSATAVERRRSFRVDGIVPDPIVTSTHAITIDAPPEQVWPWIAQMGAGRAGWHSWDLIDNGGTPSAWRVVSELQTVVPGNVMPATPRRDGRVCRRRGRSASRSRADGPRRPRRSRGNTCLNRLSAAAHGSSCEGEHPLIGWISLAHRDPAVNTESSSNAPLLTCGILAVEYPTRCPSMRRQRAQRCKKRPALRY
jgi:hypothetical protein